MPDAHNDIWFYITNTIAYIYVSYIYYPILPPMFITGMSSLYHTSQWTNNEANDDEITDDINTEDEATIDVNAMVHCNPEADAKAR